MTFPANKHFTLGTRFTFGSPSHRYASRTLWAASHTLRRTHQVVYTMHQEALLYWRQTTHRILYRKTNQAGRRAWRRQGRVVRILGMIEPKVGLASGKIAVASLDYLRPQLSSIPAREGNNPFTRGPLVLPRPKPTRKSLIECAPNRLGRAFSRAEQTPPPGALVPGEAPLAPSCLIETRLKGVPLENRKSVSHRERPWSH